MSIPAWLASVLIAAVGVCADQAPTPEQTRREVIAACKDHANEMEKRLEAMMAAPKGVFSELAIDVQRSRIALQRHDLAMLEQKPEEQIRQAGVAVDLWERQVERIRKLSDAGAVSATERADEEDRLACFRILHASVSGKDREVLKQLGIITASIDNRLASLKKLLEAAAVTEREVDGERRRAAFARYYKAALEADVAGATRHLNQVIDQDKKHLEQVKKLRQSDAASEAEELLARDRLSRSRFRLLQLEDNSKAAIEQLELQVECWDKLLRIAKAGGDAEQRITGMKYLLAYSRDRLASARVGLSKVVNDHPFVELMR